MMGWIAGVLGVGGLGAAAYFLGPAALLGFGRSIFGFLAKIPWQVYAIAAGAALIAFLLINRSHWIERAHGDEARLTQICVVTRAAAANPKLDCRQVEAQIRALGKSVAALKGALGRQNAAITALGAKTADQQKLSAEAQKRAAQRATTAEASAARLRESARHSPPAGAPCAPSKVLQEQWQ